MDEAHSYIYRLRAQVSEYFDRQAEEILRESRAAASLTTHRGLYGLAGEEAVRTFLEHHLPGKYGIGTGHVVSYDGVSAQVDAVIFDSQECFTIPITETSRLFSVEGVYAAVEVKSSPSGRSNLGSTIKTAVANIDSVHDIVQPAQFIGTSQISPLTSMSDLDILSLQGAYIMRVMRPVGVIVLVGVGASFDAVVRHFKSAIGTERRNYYPDLLCALDEKHSGLCGFDLAPGDHNLTPRFWRESCDEPGETLAALLYWLAHKMMLERVIERPLIYHARENGAKGIWPSVMAPVVRRIMVQTGNEGRLRTWPWLHETRVFE